MADSPLVGIVMGSDSDFEQMDPARQALDAFGITSEMRVMSAHRTPDIAHEYAAAAANRGLRVIIAGAGGAAALAGMLAGITTLPVIGVPIKLATLDGMDSLLSTVQMPPGVPVAAVGIGGARNAGLLAVRILASGDAELAQRYAAFAAEMAAGVEAKDRALQQRLASEASA